MQISLARSKSHFIGLCLFLLPLYGMVRAEVWKVVDEKKDANKTFLLLCQIEFVSTSLLCAARRRAPLHHLWKEQEIEWSVVCPQGGVNGWTTPTFLYFMEMHEEAIDAAAGVRLSRTP